MQNFLAKSVALATLVGGFGLTGDLAWIAERGTRVLGAADVPEQCELPATAPGGIEVHESPRTPQTIGQPQAPQVAAPAAEPPPAVRQTADLKPPTGGLGQLAWATLDPGSRVIVWLAGSPHRCLVLDFVDPATGEALLYEAATVSAEGRPLATAGPPQRVVVGRDSNGRPHAAAIIRGGLLHIAPVGVASQVVGRAASQKAGQAAGQWLGPIASLALGD